MKYFYVVLLAGGMSMNGFSQKVPGPDNTIVSAAAYEHPIKVRYKNYRGEVAVRLIVPIRYEYKATEYHPEEQWILVVWDVERDAVREYAASDIIQWFVKSA